MKAPAQRKLSFPRWIGFALEFLLIALLAYLYCGQLLLNLDATKLQQTGEHNEISTLPLLAEISLWRYREIPLWNPYALTGYPYAAGDLVSFFWNPISTIPVAVWGGINGMKVSAFLTFIIAGLGQWLFGYVIGLRRTFRLWSAILFMLSGGLALLWRVGWYGLLLGIAWFPWCFALLLRAFQRQTLPWIIATGIAVFMVLSAGGGYFPAYLFVCLGTLTIVSFFLEKSSERWRLVRTAVLVVIFSAALSAIVLVPYLDGYRLTTRDAPLDTYQYFSQPIQYGLLNYIIHTPEWFREDVLGTASGWNWFYIGWLPVAALAFVPLAYSRSRRQRWPILVSGILFAILIMWFANRYTPFKQIYEWLPVLYNYRFPNRLLIVATSPLLIVAALGLEYLYRLSKASVKNTKVNYWFSKKLSRFLPAPRLVSLYWIIVLVLTTRTVFDVNKYFAFVDQDLDTESFTALKWLKSFDPSLYYIDLGGEDIYWNWTPAAYTLEMPVINFQYNHRLRSQDEQHANGSPFFAKARYLILSVHQKPSLDTVTLIKKFRGVNVYYNPEAFPYAFSVQPTLLHEQNKLNPDQVAAMDVRLSGTNRLVIRGEPAQPGDVLVVMMSEYPGWKLLIDGQPAPVAAVNGYLGSIMQPGEHTYVFYFRPGQHLIGAAISNVTLVLVMIYFVCRAFKNFNRNPSLE